MRMRRLTSKELPYILGDVVMTCNKRGGRDRESSTKRDGEEG